jgi:chitinase
MQYLSVVKQIKAALFALLFLIFIPRISHAQFKVVGYLRSNNNLANDVKTVNLDYITYLYIAFINPEPNGEFKEYPELDSVVKVAHSKHVKVMISCGGGSRHVFLDTLLAPAHRQRVVKNFMVFAQKYALDGIDVDIENDDINANYEPFVVELGNGLHKSGKEISAALAYSTREKITDKALATFDFVTLMAYDKHAPWRPNDPGQHSPYSMAEEQISYWGGERGLKKEKLVLGVPFYGYGFGPAGASTMSFADVMNANANAYNTDEILLPDGATMYYNGFKTIRKKTALAKKKAGGVMIWQLMHDAAGANSLLSQINEEVKND